jgi:hypothetical protein
MGGCRRGVRDVKNRFSVSRCCCQGFCEDCCNGNIPAEWDIEADFTDSVCTTCDEYIAGTYTLARVPDQCFWRYDDWKDVNGWSQECDSSYTPYGDQLVRRAVSMTVLCISETHYRIQALFWVEAKFQSGQITDKDGVVWDVRNGTHLGRFYYRKDVPFTAFKCDEIAEYSLPIWHAIISTAGEGRVPPNPYNGIIVTESWSATPPTLPIGTVLGKQPGFWYIAPVCEPPANLILTAIP